MQSNISKHIVNTNMLNCALLDFYASQIRAKLLQMRSLTYISLHNSTHCIHATKLARLYQILEAQTHRITHRRLSEIATAPLICIEA